jgi:hypothetical protein
VHAPQGVQALRRLRDKRHQLMLVRLVMLVVVRRGMGWQHPLGDLLGGCVRLVDLQHRQSGRQRWRSGDRGKVKSRWLGDHNLTAWHCGFSAPQVVEPASSVDG